MEYDGAFYLHVFRVEGGLGNAVLVVLPNGRCGIVDWGTQEPAALEKALELAPEGFEFVLATHAHEDHVLGLEQLLDTCAAIGRTVGFFGFPSSTAGKKNQLLTRAREKAQELGIDSGSLTVQNIGSDWRPLSLADGTDPSWSLKLLAPSWSVAGGAEIKGLKRGVVAGNETSMVLLFRFHDYGAGSGHGRALLPGDATKATLHQARISGTREGVALDNQALLVPHHGSSHNLPDWLVEVTHGVAVVSGREDSEHHPSSRSLERLSARCAGSTGSRLYCTSYAQACRTAFGRKPPAEHRAFTAPGPCFGDLTVRLPPDAPAEVVQSSAVGSHRRPFGYCGNVA